MIAIPSAMCFLRDSARASVVGKSSDRCSASDENRNQNPVGCPPALRAKLRGRLPVISDQPHSSSSPPAATVRPCEFCTACGAATPEAPNGPSTSLSASRCVEGRSRRAFSSHKAADRTGSGWSRWAARRSPWIFPTAAPSAGSAPSSKLMRPYDLVHFHAAEPLFLLASLRCSGQLRVYTQRGGIATQLPGQQAAPVRGHQRGAAQELPRAVGEHGTRCALRRRAVQDGSVAVRDHVQRDRVRSLQADPRAGRGPCRVRVRGRRLRARDLGESQGLEACRSPALRAGGGPASGAAAAHRGRWGGASSPGGARRPAGGPVADGVHGSAGQRGGPRAGHGRLLPPLRQPGVLRQLGGRGDGARAFRRSSSPTAGGRPSTSRTAGPASSSRTRPVCATSWSGSWTTASSGPRSVPPPPPPCASVTRRRRRRNATSSSTPRRSSGVEGDEPDRARPGAAGRVAAQHDLGSQEREARRMRLTYLSEANIPSRSSNATQTMRMSAAFAEAGAEVTLVHPVSRRPEPEGFTGDVAAFYGIRASFERRVLRAPADSRRSRAPGPVAPVRRPPRRPRSTGPAAVRVLRAVALGGLGRRPGAPGLGSPRGLQGRGRRAPRRAAPGGLAAAERGRRDRDDQRRAAPPRPRRGARARGPGLGRARRGGPGRGRSRRPIAARRARS